MQLRFKFITFVISVSLLFVFSYQLYWLINFFNDQNIKMESAIMNAVDNAKFKDVALKLTSYITTGFYSIDKEEKNDIKEIFIEFTSENNKLIKSELSINDSIFNHNNKSISKNIDSDLKDMMHIIDSGLNISFDYNIFGFYDLNSKHVNIADSINKTITINSMYKFDSLLSIEFKQLGINIPYYIEYINNNDSVVKRVPDTFSENERQKFEKYNFPVSTKKLSMYNLYFKSPKLYIFKDMLGIIIISFFMIIILIASYLYLLKIIRKQKSIDEIKSDFISNITHELKTPISVTYAAVDALQNFGVCEDPEKRDEYLSISKEQLLSLNSLVEQILTMSVEERKNLKLSIENISITNLFESLKNQFSLNSNKEIEFEIAIDPENININADKIHFLSIMNNLIENAVKYSNNNLKIKLSAKYSDNKTLISVCDNGIGIPKDSINKIFDRFYRVSKGNIHDVKGYGLGLFYVKTIIDKHGWTIDVDSVEGKGSCFNIHIS